MRRNDIVLIVGGTGTLAAQAADMIVNSSATADIYIGPPPIDLRSGPKHEPFLEACPYLERKSKTRDWEQRNRKRRK